MSRRHVPTIAELFEWAAGWSERSNAKSGEQWPTVRVAARRFCCRQREIEAVLDGDCTVEDGYLGIGVGFQVGGLGGGTADIEKLGDYIVEAYRTSDVPVLDTPESVIDRISLTLGKPGVSLYPVTPREWRLVMMQINGAKR
jgi:hypothetical protein